MDKFNYYSRRAREARFSKIFKNPALRLLIWLLIFASLVGFFYVLFFLHNSLGWLLLGLTIIGCIFMTWLKHEATPVPVGRTDDINDLLSRNVLRLMGPQPTPQDLANRLSQTRSGKFLALRFGLTPELLLQVASEIPADLEPVLATARQIWQKTDGETISGGMIAVAILQNHFYFLKKNNDKIKSCFLIIENTKRQFFDS